MPHTIEDAVILLIVVVIVIVAVNWLLGLLRRG